MSYFDAAIKILGAHEKNYREAQIYFSVPYHENIVERFAADAFNFRGQPSIFIAMERCDCNLYDHIKSEVGDGIPFDAEKYTWISYQVLVALEFLHSHNVVHGGFKPANVLLILNGNVVKVSDFGLSRAVMPGNTSPKLTSPQGGVTGWQAPEVLNGSACISFKSDVFNCGLTLFFIWSYGKHAYGSRPLSRSHYIIEGIKRDLEGMLVPFPSEAKTLLERTLQLTPAKRPTVKEIMRSQIFERYKLQQDRMDDSVLAEIFDSALQKVSQGSKTRNQDESVPLGVMTVGQFEDALSSFIQRNHQQLNRMTTDLPISRLSSGPSSTEPGPNRSQGQPLSPSMRTKLNGTRLCRRGCNIIVASPFSEEPLLPRFNSQIYKDSTYNGKGEFMKCDRRSNPEMIQERLANIPTCNDGITMIIVACLNATKPLSHALSENNLRTFLRKKGLSGGALQEKIQNIRQSLAVFALDAWNNVPNDVAKITININLDENGDSRLQAFENVKGKIENEVAFSGTNFKGFEDYVYNEDVMRFLRKCLQREHSIEYCSHH